MADRSVTMRGVALPLTGPELKIGDTAPDFRLQQRSPEGLREVTLADYEGKTLILSVLPSLDTSVCEIMTKRFDEEAMNLPLGIEVLTVSMDLPYAQARFCNDKGTHHIHFASDHRNGTFGEAYGTLIEQLRLEARALFVVGTDKLIKFVQYVPEVSDQPDYYGALAAAREQLD